MNKHTLGIGIGIGIILLITAIAVISLWDNNNPAQTLNYKATVCVFKNNELIECKKNVLTDTGKNFVRDSLQGGVNKIDQIALGNGTAPIASSTSLNSEITTCGLAKATGTITNNTPAGNWSVTYTFTSTCDGVPINTTGLYKNGGNMFAGTNFVTTTLYNNDQIKINWTISVSES